MFWFESRGKKNEQKSGDSRQNIFALVGKIVPTRSFPQGKTKDCTGITFIYIFFKITFIVFEKI